MNRRVTAVCVAFVFLGGQLVFAQQIDSTEKTGRPPVSFNRVGNAPRV